MNDITRAAAKISLPFDYSALDIDSNAMTELRRAADDIHVHRGKIGVSIVEIGRALLTAKARLPHGHFGRWLVAEFHWTDRTARNFMMATERFDGKTEIISELQPTTIYLLAAPSTPISVCDEVVSRREAGEHLPDRTIKMMVVEAKRTKTAKDHRRLTREAREARRGRSEGQRQALEDDLQRQRQRDAALARAATIICEGIGDALPELLKLFEESGPGGLWRLPEALAKTAERSGKTNGLAGMVEALHG